MSPFEVIFDMVGDMFSSSLQGVLIIILLGIGMMALCGYLVGSVPFGLIFTKLAGLGDVRKVGSGNIGATNVLRMGNKKIAALTLLADMLKGTIATGFFMYPSSEIMWPGLLAGFFAFLGHLFPIWLKFKGGKGVATYLGVLIVIFPWGGVIFACIWLLTAVITRYSSLSALLAASAAAAASFFFTTPETIFTITLMSVIIVAKHHANITRLIKGTETRINLRGK